MCDENQVDTRLRCYYPGGKARQTYGGNLHWKQTEKSDPQITQKIHDGLGDIKRRSLFKESSRLPIQMEIWELDEGVSEGDHIHDASRALEEVYYFLEGEGEMTIDGNKISVKSNDSVMVPPGTDHGISNTGKTPLKLMIVWGIAVGEYEM